jgi:hypothetical protein
MFGTVTEKIFVTEHCALHMEESTPIPLISVCVPTFGSEEDFFNEEFWLCVGGIIIILLHF